MRELVEIGSESAGERLGSHIDGGDTAVAVAGSAAVNPVPLTEVGTSPAGGGGAEALPEVLHDGDIVGKGEGEERE